MFPKNFENFQQHILASKETIEAAIREKKEAAKKAEKIISENELVLEILEGLLTSWKETDPGKNCDVFFFLDLKQETRVVVRELLPADTKICKSPKEWNIYKQKIGRYEKYDRIPIWYPVVSLSEVAHGKCDKCGSSEPIVEHYVQTYDSAEADNWLKEKIVLCMKCNKTTMISRENSSYRF